MLRERTFKPKFKIPASSYVNPYGIDQRGMVFWKNRKNGFMVAACHYTADPEKRSEEWFRDATKDLRESERDREYEINFESRAGKKAFGYLELKPRRWRIRDMDLKKIPRNWRIIAALDYGTQNPTSIHFYAIDERRRFYSIYEFYKPSNVREIAAVLKGEHQGPNIDGTWTDFRHPLWARTERVVVDGAIFKKDQDQGSGEGHKSIGDLIQEQGIYIMERATKDRIAGLARVHDMFRYDPDRPKKPFLYICERCKHQWNELLGLVYEETAPHLLLNKNHKEDIVAKNDHAYDELRYALMSIESPSNKRPEPRPGEGTFGAIEKEIEMDDHEKVEVDFF